MQQLAASAAVHQSALICSALTLKRSTKGCAHASWARHFHGCASAELCICWAVHLPSCSSAELCVHV